MKTLFHPASAKAVKRRQALASKKARRRMKFRQRLIEARQAE